MKKLLTIFLILTFNISSAHPGIGIVKDSKGNTYGESKAILFFAFFCTGITYGSCLKWKNKLLQV